MVAGSGMRNYHIRAYATWGAEAHALPVLDSDILSNTFSSAMCTWVNYPSLDDRKNYSGWYSSTSIHLEQNLPLLTCVVLTEVVGCRICCLLVGGHFEVECAGFPQLQNISMSQHDHGVTFDFGCLMSCDWTTGVSADVIWGALA